jgi:hypothetical protein
MENTSEFNQESNAIAHPQVIFNFLEYLQDLKGKLQLSEESAESVEVSLQCLTSAFELDLQNEAQRKQYSIKPQSLDAVIALGLQGRDKIKETLQQLVRNFAENIKLIFIVSRHFITYLSINLFASK